MTGDAPTIDPAATREASALLWGCWSAGRKMAALPERCRPKTIDDGWLVQRALDAHAGPAVGWKIAATSPAGQAHIGAEAPLVGRLYERTLVPSGGELDFDALEMCSAEAEFGFRIAADLIPGEVALTRERVLSAVGPLHPVIEVPDSRFADFAAVGVPSLVADAMCAAYVVVGDAVERWNPRSLPLHPVSMRRNGKEIAIGSGANVLGDPCEALLWLAEELRGRGEVLRAGDLVITGACTPPNAIAPSDALRADFGTLGAVEARMGELRS